MRFFKRYEYSNVIAIYAIDYRDIDKSYIKAVAANCIFHLYVKHTSKLLYSFS